MMTSLGGPQAAFRVDVQSLTGMTIVALPLLLQSYLFQYPRPLAVLRTAH